jgi:hypothetical protein
MSTFDLTLAEQETIIYSNATDRSAWEVCTSDPVWQRRLEALGAQCIRERGATKWYALADGQLLLRKGKRNVSEEQRAQSAARMRSMRQTQQPVLGSTPKQALLAIEQRSDFHDA